MVNSKPFVGANIGVHGAVNDVIIGVNVVIIGVNVVIGVVNALIGAVNDVIGAVNVVIGADIGVHDVVKMTARPMKTALWLDSADILLL